MRLATARVLERDGLLRRLRGDGGPRPVIDPGLAGGLRDWLEDGLVERWPNCRRESTSCG